MSPLARLFTVQRSRDVYSVRRALSRLHSHLFTLRAQRRKRMRPVDERAAAVAAIADVDATSCACACARADRVKRQIHRRSSASLQQRRWRRRRRRLRFSRSSMSPALVRKLQDDARMPADMPPHISARARAFGSSLDTSNLQLQRFERSRVLFISFDCSSRRILSALNCRVSVFVVHNCASLRQHTCHKTSNCSIAQFLYLRCRRHRCSRRGGEAAAAFVSAGARSSNTDARARALLGCSWRDGRSDDACDGLCGFKPMRRHCLKQFCSCEAAAALRSSNDHYDAR